MSPEQLAAFDTRKARDFSKDDFPLLPVRVRTWGCFVFVNLSGQARELSRWLGDLPERLARFPLHELRLVRRRPFTIQANWKLVAENFMEYYHLPWVHPEMEGHYRFQGPGLYTGMVTSPLTSNPNACTFDLPKMPGLNEFES